MDYLWFSNDGESYIIGYDGTWQMVLPDWVPDSLEIPFRNKKVTEIQLDDAAKTFFIRYS